MQNFTNQWTNGPNPKQITLTLHDDTSQNRKEPADGHPKGMWRKLFARMLLVCLAGAGLLVAGFIWFWLASVSVAQPDNAKADAVVVLTGGHDRISRGVRLLEAGAGKRLLISGVFKRTTATRLRQLTGAKQDLFACCVDLDYRSRNTRDNASETRRWAEEKGFTSLIVVTSNYHILRAIMELKYAFPKAELIASPVSSDKGNSPWANPVNMRLWISEYVKYLLALVRVPLGL